MTGGSTLYAAGGTQLEVVLRLSWATQEYEAFDFAALKALAYNRLVISGDKLRFSPDFAGLAVHLAVGSTDPM